MRPASTFSTIQLSNPRIIIFCHCFIPPEILIGTNLIISHPKCFMHSTFTQITS